jgi:ABC-2 type transport system permease protein
MFAIVRQELYLTLHSIEVIVDVFVFPLVNIVVFGFLSSYLGVGENSLAGQYVISGMLLWQIIWIIEYSVSVGSLWNIWARNLSNLFVAPLQLKEYILAYALSGVLKSFVMLAVSGVLAVYVFNFNLLSLGVVPLILVYLNFAFFSFSFGVIILGLIFRFGTRIQAFSWGLVTIFQPLSAAFYPLSVLPAPIQFIAGLFPSTYTYEAARYALVNHAVNWRLFEISFAQNIFYFVVSVVFFAYMFKKSKDTGQFARNEA